MIQLISPKILDESHKRCLNYEVLNVILPILKVTKLNNFKQCQFQQNNDYIRRIKSHI